MSTNCRLATPETEKESVERLTRVGFDNIKGFLNGGFETWKNADKKCHHR